MERVVISDASCFIVLEKIGQIELLRKLYGEVIISPKVAQEFGHSFPGWIAVHQPKNKNESIVRLFEDSVDAGEASAIALAVEHKGCYLILDDNRARKLAASLKIDYTGTLGVIISAKNRGIIPAVRPLFEKILKTNFWVSLKLVEDILKELNE